MISQDRDKPIQKRVFNSSVEFFAYLPVTFIENGLAAGNTVLNGDNTVESEILEAVVSYSFA